MLLTIFPSALFDVVLVLDLVEGLFASVHLVGAFVPALVAFLVVLVPLAVFFVSLPVAGLIHAVPLSFVQVHLVDSDSSYFPS